MLYVYFQTIITHAIRQLEQGSHSKNNECSFEDFLWQWHISVDVSVVIASSRFQRRPEIAVGARLDKKALTSTPIPTITCVSMPLESEMSR